MSGVEKLGWYNSSKSGLLFSGGDYGSLGDCSGCRVDGCWVWILHIFDSFQERLGIWVVPRVIPRCPGNYASELVVLRLTV